jgi:hypothetical protein
MEMKNPICGYEPNNNSTNETEDHGLPHAVEIVPRRLTHLAPCATGSSVTGHTEPINQTDMFCRRAVVTFNLSEKQRGPPVVQETVLPDDPESP